MILTDARKCKHCGEIIDGDLRAYLEAQRTDKSPKSHLGLILGLSGAAAGVLAIAGVLAYFQWQEKAANNTVAANKETPTVPKPQTVPQSPLPFAPQPVTQAPITPSPVNPAPAIPAPVAPPIQPQPTPPPPKLTGAQKVIAAAAIEKMENTYFATKANNFREHILCSADAIAMVKEANRLLPAGELKTYLNEALEAYLSAGTILGCLLTKAAGDVGPDEKEIYNRYKLPQVGRRAAMELLWAVGANKIANAKRLLR